MIAEFTPSSAKGIIKAPPSKSAAHREIICSCLSGGACTVRNIDFSQDILATLDCMRALGAEISIYENSIEIQKPLRKNAESLLNCRESGSTLRFLIPLSLLYCEKCTFTGSERLLSRPLSVYEDLFLKSGIQFKKSLTSVTVGGCLKPGKFTVPGNISSQFISGLLFALPLLDGDSQIEILPPAESRPYIDMTLKSLSNHGISCRFIKENIIEIKGNQSYSALDSVTPGDWSNSAFFSALNYIGGNVDVTGLDNGSSQGDKIYPEIFKLLQSDNSEIDLSDCPDLGPVCMALAYKHGAVFTGTERLAAKESDRCSSMAQELAKFGIKTEYKKDSFRVFPCKIKAPADTLCGHNDHRIVMSLSVLCSLTGGKIEGAQAVSKSLPDFFDRLKALGIKVKTYENA